MNNAPDGRSPPTPNEQYLEWARHLRDVDQLTRAQITGKTGVAHTVTSLHDPSGRPIHIVHTLTDLHGDSADYPVTLHYATPVELDAMATVAGLSPAARWRDWTGAPAGAHSHDPISIYVR